MSDECVCYQEVARLHHFFEQWFRGDLEESAFARCEAALAPGFTIVTPGGEQIERDEILAAIRRHHAGEPPEFRITTRPRRCQRVRGTHITAYEEHQIGTRETIRLSTAVLSEVGGVLEWHAVHETWITT